MNIQSIQQQTTPIFDQYSIAYAGLFGSTSRGQETLKSDVDIMVKFEKPLGMFKYMEFINALEDKLQRKVDIVTVNSINKHVKPFIMKDLQTLYEK